jgi:hypothetical protein
VIRNDRHRRTAHIARTDAADGADPRPHSFQATSVPEAKGADGKVSLNDA